MAANATPPVESAKDFGKGPQGEARRLLAEVELFESEVKRQFVRNEKIIKRYRNESWRDDVVAADGADSSGRGFAMFWANVETLKPTIYAHEPKADVQRRWKDKDPVARCASEILERCLDFFIDTEAFRDSTRACRDDYLIVAQGVQRHRYVPHFHDAEIKQPVRIKTGRGDGQKQVANSTGPGVADQGLQLTNNAPPYDPDDYEYEDDDGNAQPLTIDDQIEDGDQGPYVIRSQQEIASEEWVQDYVYWRDFGWTPGARTWAEVYCVWFKNYMTRAELVDRFGEEIGKAVQLDYELPNTAGYGEAAETSKAEFYKKATIYERWDSTTRKTQWFAKSYDGDLLDERPYPLKLTGKFPCQKPVFATQTNGKITAVPDYIQYQDQAQEMDRLTQRIYTIMDAIKVKGLYAANIPELGKLMQDAGELDMVPVDTSLLSLFNGDITKAIYFLPLEDLIQALNELLAARERVKQDAYEITGISDIIRGATDPNETLGAQQLKAQTGAIRIRDRQAAFSRFVCDGLRIGADIITGHFTPESIADVCDLKTVPEANFVMGPNGEWTDPAELAKMMAPAPPPVTAQAGPPAAGAQPPSPSPAAPPMPGVPAGIPIPPMMGHNGGPPMPTETLGQAAIKLLKDPLQRQFRIDIETDSTVAIDEASEKQARTEFVTAVTGFMEASAQISVTPFGSEVAPLLGEILLFAVRGFKAGSQLEGSIEAFVEQMQAKAKNPPPPQPDPEMIKAQAQAQATQAAAQNDQMKTQGELAIQQAESQREGQAHAVEMQHEAVSRQGELAAEQQRQQTDAQAGALDLAGKHMDLTGKGIDLQIAEARLKEAKAPKPKPTNGSAK